jgi:hypothetical protein
MKKNYLLWIGLGVVAAGVIVYFAFFRKKKKSNLPAIAPAEEFDWAALQKKFATGNPYSSDLVVVKQEVSEIGENSPIKYTDFDLKTVDTNYRTRGKITKEQFDQRVLSSIRMQIAQKNYDLLKTVQEELNLWWTPVARAGYNDSFERALAYHIRRILAGDFYYDTAGTPTNSAVQTPAQTPATTPTPTPPPTNSSGGVTAQRYTY